MPLQRVSLPRAASRTVVPPPGSRNDPAVGDPAGGETAVDETAVDGSTPTTDTAAEDDAKLREVQRTKQEMADFIAAAKRPSKS